MKMRSFTRSLVCASLLALVALFQDELPVYMPWSEERRRKSDVKVSTQPGKKSCCTSEF